MRYQIRATDSPDAFLLYDLKDHTNVAVGSFPAIRSMSQEMNLEDMLDETNIRRERK